MVTGGWVCIARGIVVGLACGEHSSGVVLVTLGKQVLSCRLAFATRCIDLMAASTRAALALCE